MSKGIDLDHNRFLILQGEVEAISLMKPKAETANEDGFLEYLEDIIGTDHLNPPIKELEGKLEKVNDVRHTQGDAMKMAEGFVRDMEGPKKDAVGFWRFKMTCYAL